jgi:hypothetical protein
VGNIMGREAEGGFSVYLYVLHGSGTYSSSSNVLHIIERLNTPLLLMIPGVMTLHYTPYKRLSAPPEMICGVATLLHK